MAIPLRLKIYKDDALVGTREFERDLIKVGRLASAHLSLDDEKVARIHLVINAESAERLNFVDMGGLEGTYLNGKRCAKGQLSFGDELRLGSTRLVVEDGSVPEVSETASASGSEQAAPAAASSDDAASALEMALAAVVPMASQPPTAGALPGQPEPEAQAAQMAAAASVASAAPFAASVPPPQEPVLPQKPQGRPTQFGTYVYHDPVARRPSNRKCKLGLNIRYYWGDTLLEAYQLGKLKPAFVGGGDKFFGGEKSQFHFTSSALGGVVRHQLISTDGNNFVLHLGPTMNGGIDRESTGMEPLAANSTCVLQPVDFAWVNVGNIRIELSFDRQSKPIVVPWYSGLDFRFLCTLFVICFIMGAFMITASTHTEADIIADDIGEKQLKMVKAFIQEAEKPKKNPLLDKLNKKEKKVEQPQGGEMAEKHKGQEGKMGRKDMAPNKNKRSAPKAIDINAKDLVKHSGGLVSVLGGGGGGGGLATIFGQGGLGGDIKGAIGNMHGPQVGDAGGFGGLGLRGTGTGGGGSGNTIGIGGIGTKGRGGGLGGYGAGVGGLGGKKKSDVAISDGESTIQGSLDKELIRQVIQRNMGQIRYCYEKELQRKPDLAGKVVIRFEISGSGSVPNAKVHSGTTLRDAALGECITVRIRNWRFPEPKGGGKVIVTYPFVFKSSGD